ncbi:MAG: hypothetical protein Kow0022_05780 [Phycisphaerales bacterium]
MMAKKKTKKKATKKVESPQQRLLRLADEAIECAKIAKRHSKSLKGANHYADKLSSLRAEAALAFQALGSLSLGDTSALAELIETIFAADSRPADRASALRNLKFEMATKWRDTPAEASFYVDGGIFPLETLKETKRSYLVSVGRQANGSYDAGYYDCAAVMMRRLLEISIIEAFEAKKIDGKIKDKEGQFLQLTQLIEKALAESSWNLPRTVKKNLRELRDLGHRSAHGRYYLAKKPIWIITSACTANRLRRSFISRICSDAHPVCPLGLRRF